MSQTLPDTVSQAVLQDLQAHALPGRGITTISLGSHLAAVLLEPVRDAPPGLGLASRVDADHGRSLAGEPQPGDLARDWGLDTAGANLDAMALAGLLARPVAEPTQMPAADTAQLLLQRCLALAAANALLPPPPPAELSEVKGQDLLLERGRNRRVVVVGHFPFVEKISHNFADFQVLERRPRPGDLPAAESERLLPQADVAAITSTTISNGTLPGLLQLCRPDCFVLLLGPSTPLAPSLFELGVNALAGALPHAAESSESVLEGVRAGQPFKTLKGMRPVLWMRS